MAEESNYGNVESPGVLAYNPPIDGLDDSDIGLYCTPSFAAPLPKNNRSRVSSIPSWDSLQIDPYASTDSEDSEAEEQEVEDHNPSARTSNGADTSSWYENVTEALNKNSQRNRTESDATLLLSGSSAEIEQDEEQLYEAVDDDAHIARPNSRALASISESVSIDNDEDSQPKKPKININSSGKKAPPTVPKPKATPPAHNGPIAMSTSTSVSKIRGISPEIAASCHHLLMEDMMVKYEEGTTGSQAKAKRLFFLFKSCLLYCKRSYGQLFCRGQLPISQLVVDDCEDDVENGFVGFRLFSYPKNKWYIVELTGVKDALARKKQWIEAFRVADAVITVRGRRTDSEDLGLMMAESDRIELMEKVKAGLISVTEAVSSFQVDHGTPPKVAKYDGSKNKDNDNDNDKNNDADDNDKNVDPSDTPPDVSIRPLPSVKDTSPKGGASRPPPRPLPSVKDNNKPPTIPASNTTKPVPMRAPPPLRRRLSSGVPPPVRPRSRPPTDVVESDVQDLEGFYETPVHRDETCSQEIFVEHLLSYFDRVDRDTFLCDNEADMYTFGANAPSGSTNLYGYLLDVLGTASFQVHRQVAIEHIRKFVQNADSEDDDDDDDDFASETGIFLTKRAFARGKKDRRRWFELHGVAIRYFSNMVVQNGVCLGVGWKGVIPLSADTDVTNNDVSLVVINPDRVWELVADNARDALRWRNKLLLAKQAIGKSKPKSVKSDSTGVIRMEGI